MRYCFSEKFSKKKLHIFSSFPILFFVFLEKGNFNNVYIFFERALLQ